MKCSFSNGRSKIDVILFWIVSDVYVPLVRNANGILLFHNF